MRKDIKVINHASEITLRKKSGNRNFVDIEGKKFGRLLVIGYLGQSLTGRSLWLFKCECGSYIRTSRKLIEAGNTNCCGCARQPAA
jgi:hypothetical protein